MLLANPVGEAENYHATGSFFVPESEPIYDDGSPFSVDFYDPKIVPETEQDNLDPLLPKLLSCFVRIEPLVLIDEIEEDPAPLQKINTSELVTDDIEDYTAPLQKSIHQNL